jgi:ferrous iron transport protein B
MVEDSSNSILAYLGSIIAPIFLPLGFKDWRASTALITGLTAKEAVVSTLSVLTGTVTDIELSQVLFTIFTPLSAFAFLTFTLLYMPCIAAFAATKRELGSIKYAVLTALYQTATAYVTGTLVFQIGSILIGG